MACPLLLGRSCLTPSLPASMAAHSKPADVKHCMPCHACRSTPVCRATLLRLPQPQGVVRVLHEPLAQQQGGLQGRRLAHTQWCCYGIAFKQPLDPGMACLPPALLCVLRPFFPFSFRNSFRLVCVLTSRLRISFLRLYRPSPRRTWTSRRRCCCGRGWERRPTCPSVSAGQGMGRFGRVGWFGWG